MEGGNKTTDGCGGARDQFLDGPLFVRFDGHAMPCHAMRALIPWPSSLRILRMLLVVGCRASEFGGPSDDDQVLRL